MAFADVYPAPVHITSSTTPATGVIPIVQSDGTLPTGISLSLRNLTGGDIVAASVAVSYDGTIYGAERSISRGLPLAAGSNLEIEINDTAALKYRVTVTAASAGTVDLVLLDEPAPRRAIGSLRVGGVEDDDVEPVLRVRAATTANITLSAAQTIDGVAVVAGDRVLVKNQSTASQNGVYVVGASAWSRASDLAAGAAAAGLQVYVAAGTVNADIVFVCTSDAGSDVVGTNSLVFASGAVVDSLLLHKAGAESVTGVKTFTAAPIVAPTASASGTPASALAVTVPADLLITASTEAPSVYINLSATRQWATGALTAQRGVVITAPTLAFVGASTVTHCATVNIEGAPIAGTNATFTNSYALLVTDGLTKLGGAVVLGSTLTLGGNLVGAASWTKVDGTTKVIEVDATGLGFYGVAPVARQVLATGGGATADQIITALQNLGLLAQS